MGVHLERLGIGGWHDGVEVEHMLGIHGIPLAQVAERGTIGPLDDLALKEGMAAIVGIFIPQVLKRLGVGIHLPGAMAAAFIPIMIGNSLPVIFISRITRGSHHHHHDNDDANSD